MKAYVVVETFGDLIEDVEVFLDEDKAMNFWRRKLKSIGVFYNEKLRDYEDKDGEQVTPGDEAWWHFYTVPVKAGRKKKGGRK